jgi:hypothetical protein
LGTYIINSKVIDYKNENEVFKKFENYSGVTHLKFIESIINGLQPSVYAYQIKKGSGFASNYSYYNYIKVLAYNNVDRIFDYYFSEINNEIRDKEELTYKLALFYKLKGFIPYDRSKKERESNFSKALNYYLTLSKDFIEKNANIGIQGSPDSKSIKRSILFLYPAPISEIQTWGIFNIYNRPNHLDFINYLIRNNNLQSLYYSKDEWSNFEIFLYNLFNVIKSDEYEEKDSLEYSLFNLAEKFISTNFLARTNVDSNFIYLVQANKNFVRNDTLNAYKYFKRADQKKIFSEEFQKGEYPKDGVNKYLLKSIAEQMAINNKTNESLKLIFCFYEPYFRRNALINTTLKLVKNSVIENSFIYLDSIYKEIEKEPKYGLKLIQVNAMIGGQEMYNLTTKLIKDSKDTKKPRALVLFVRGVAYNGNYFKAKGYIPDYISSSNELELYTEIMKAEVKRNLKNIAFSKNKVYNFYTKYDNENINFGVGDQDEESNFTGGVVYYD